MSLMIRVYGTVEAFPTMDELIEQLEEGEFEVTLETEEDDDDEDNWTDLFVYESSLDEPVSIRRFEDPDTLKDEIQALKDTLSEYEESEEGSHLLNVLENCSVAFSVEAPEEIAEEDNALLLCTLLAQILAQRSDGLYSVDSEGFFNENGELIFELASED
jgi:hypothetical protein